MMTILILTPVWGRPEILKIFLAGIERLRKSYPHIILLCIVSPEDKYHDYLVDMIIDVGGEVCEFSNKHLGAKQNYGLDFALKEFKFKYLMQMGSDDILNPGIFKLYEPYMKSGEKVFGVNNVYFYEYCSGDCIFVEDYNDNHPMGVARMYKYDSLLEVLNIHKKKLWPERSDDGMDGMSIKTLRSCGIKPLSIDIKETPYVLDIKTNTNIWHFKLVQNYKEKDIDFKTISKYFGIIIYDDWILRLNDFYGFDEYVKSFEEMGMSGITSYGETEKIYRMYFGENKYKNYDSFKNVRSSKRNNPL